MAEVLVQDPVKRPFTFTFVALADHKQQTTIKVEHEFLSLAYADAFQQASTELGKAVVLQQDHPHYKHK